MKKSFIPAVKKTAKSAFAVSLAAAMVVPNVAIAAEGDAAAETTAEATVAVPEPIKVIDFNDGLQSLKDDDNFSITQSEQLYFQKEATEVGASEVVDANGLVYTGSGNQAHYHKGLISNQPTTAYDEEKGTVLKIGKSQSIPAIYKTQEAGVEDADTSAQLDKEVPVSTVAIQDAYTANSEIVISNPFGSKELQESMVEYSEFDLPQKNVTWKLYRGNYYQPIWTKGLTVSYWINVPSDENGQYKPSSALRWELLDQMYYQADDYAKHLACAYYEVEKASWSDEAKEIARTEESQAFYGSDYYYKYEESFTNGTDENGVPVPVLRSDAGFTGPVYDSRFCNGEGGARKSAYYQFNPLFTRGYYLKSDGTLEAQSANLVGSDVNYYSQYASLEIEEGSWVRRAMEDGELQIDVDDSIFWVPDNNLGINLNSNVKTSYGTKAGMQNGDVFFMNSWREGTEPLPNATGYTYQSAYSAALSPVTSLDENGVGVKNGNCDSWHQVTVTFQNDWVEFYVDGVKSDVDLNYSSRGGTALDSSKSFKRLNKGTGLRYGWGSEKGAIDFSYGNYVCRLLMDWMTDEEATLHIGGAGMYADEYAQATTSCEFSIDDLKFYDQLLDEDQIVAAYEAEAATLNSNKENDVYGTFADLKSVSDASVGVETAPVVEAATIGDKTIDSVKVEGNTKQNTSTAAQLANPFAGKDLEGATISYYVKQDDAERTSVLSFIDTPKHIENPKDSAGNGDASSILYVESNGTASFIEGYSDSSIAEKMKNTYVTATNDDNANKLLQDAATDWQYITVTMNNGGISYYVNGEPVSNEAAFPTGVRFLDGYYQRLSDENDVQTRYGIFGSTNNQGGSTLMNFITATDTAIYLGSLPMKGNMGYNKTAGAAFAAVKTVDAALSAEEVKAMYEHRFDGAPEPSVKPGRVDPDDEDVTLQDALLVLQIALKIKSDATEAQIQAADVDGDGDVTLDDALKVLRVALKIDPDFI